MTAVCVRVFFLGASGCCGRIRRLERQRSEIGQQASSDKTCLEQTKARLCGVGTSPDHFDPLALPAEPYKNLPHIFRCLSRNQSLVRCAGSFLRTAPAFLRLITWQPLWGQEVLPALQVSTLNKSLTPYTRSRLSALMNNILCCSHVTISHQLGLTRTGDTFLKVLHRCGELISALLCPPIMFHIHIR